MAFIINFLADNVSQLQLKPSILLQKVFPLMNKTMLLINCNKHFKLALQILTWHGSAYFAKFSSWLFQRDELVIPETFYPWTWNQKSVIFGHTQTSSVLSLSIFVSAGFICINVSFICFFKNTYIFIKYSCKYPYSIFERWFYRKQNIHQNHHPKFPSTQLANKISLIN